MIRVFIGFDKQEVVAYNVLAFSVFIQSTEMVSITPLSLTQLKDVFQRERDQLQSTEFSYTRFLVPYLCGYEGWAIFMDSDMLLQDDIAKLWSLRDESKSVMVVKHNYSPKDKVKFLGHTQTTYERKNWSSLMLFNNKKCRSLTLDYVNFASGIDLHQFKWIENEIEIGELPINWNFLVGEYKIPDFKPSILHYTTGGPYHKNNSNSDFAENWIDMLKKMLDSNGVPFLPIE